MNEIKALFDINNTMFTIMGYQMSYIEFFGTIANILCVYLVSRGKTINWPIGIIGSLLYIVLFYQIQLYSDVIEQGYFLLTGFVGWYIWYTRGFVKEKFTPTWISPKEHMIWGGVLFFGTLAMTFLVSNLHTLMPSIFTTPADYPLLDSFTTVASLVATVFLIKKKVDAWILWIIVDIIGIWLYWVKDVRFISLEYVLFLGLATYGLIKWIRMSRQTPDDEGYIQAFRYELDEDIEKMEVPSGV